MGAGIQFSREVGRAVKHVAPEVARECQRDYVGTEHLLLALVRTFPRAFRHLCDPDTLEEVVGECTPRGRARELPRGSAVPFTSRAKKVLDLSMREAESDGSAVVQAEHLVVGLIREEKGIAAQALRELGIRLR